MSTGPWHYKEAERLLELAQNDKLILGGEQTSKLINTAAAHATLALAAATALQASDIATGMATSDYNKWQDAASSVPPQPDDEEPF